MRVWQEVAYKENTTEGWLLKNGYDIKFSEWLEDNSYFPFNGFELFVHLPTRELILFNKLKEMYEQNNKMTPEETAAKELIDKFNNAQYNGCVICSNSPSYHQDQLFFAKQCALICIEEIINYVADTPAYREVDSLKKIKQAIQKA